MSGECDICGNHTLECVCGKKKITIDCISDLHGYFPKLKGGDLLVIAGDLLKNEKKEGIYQFEKWISEVNYRKKIFIAGNHDKFLINEIPRKFKTRIGNKEWENFEYLCDSGTEFEGLKIWGSPWSLWFHGIHPSCKAFTGTEKELNKKYDLIPEDIDILITHSPPYGILDGIPMNECGDGKDYLTGSESLINIVSNEERLPNLKLHVFGHIHENGGKTFETNFTKFVNASIVNENYRHVNKPVRIEL